MNIKKFAQFADIVSRRDTRMKVVPRARKKLHIEFMADELEQRQLLATFNYNSGTGLLTVVTNQNSETLSIVSTSNAGNYTISTGNEHLKLALPHFWLTRKF